MRFPHFNTMEELLAMEIIEMFPFTPSPFSLRQVVFGCFVCCTVCCTVYRKYIVFTVYTEIEKGEEKVHVARSPPTVFILLSGDASPATVLTLVCVLYRNWSGALPMYYFLTVGRSSFYKNIHLSFEGESFGNKCIDSATVTAD